MKKKVLTSRGLPQIEGDVEIPGKKCAHHAENNSPERNFEDVINLY